MALGYRIDSGSPIERPLLLKLMQQCYQELYPQPDVSHLESTVDRYLSVATPLWFAKLADANPSSQQSPIGCLWMGNATDQIAGRPTAYIFLLYVMPHYRRQGIGTALLRKAEDWAKTRGDRQIGLQVFLDNEHAFHLYEKLGYHTQSLWMVKNLGEES
jgi:ribosomal protein S18 acetylase RimI-like enzyme